MGNGKSVLLISYYFPPLGLGGVGRPYALARYLPEKGITVHTVTVKEIFYPNYDNTLLDDLDKRRVHRTESWDPARLLYKMGKKKQRRTGFPSVTGRIPLYFPDLKRGWNRFALKKAEELLEEHAIDLVITTSPPPSSHMVGLKLKKKYKTKWIADFRDYWFPLPIELIYKYSLMRKYALKLKQEILSNADEVVAVNEDISKYLGRGKVIYNGAESYLVDLWNAAEYRRSNDFRIGLFGTFNELVPVEPILKAVSNLISSYEQRDRPIRVFYAGHVDDEIIDLIDFYRLRDRIKLPGYLPKQSAIEMMRTCDLFYIGLKNIAPYHILPGRVFELMLSGKPILGLVPKDSALARMLDDYPPGILVSDESELRNTLGKVYQGEAEFGPTPVREELYKYTYHRLGDEYAVLINNILK